MRPVSGGTQKLTMDSQERDYQQRKRQAIAQGDGNPSVFGIQGGYGDAVKQSRNQQYGNVNNMPQDYESDSNFSQGSEVANNPASQERNQTGSIESGTSQTDTPQENPEDMATDALERRLALYREAGNAAAGNNNRAQTMRMS